MRIQEHMYQGFFGLNKKQNANKYYHERVEKLKGFDEDLDNIITAFQNILTNHNNKLVTYQKFLNNRNSNTFNDLRNEIQKLKGIYDEDELANDKEQKYVIKGRDLLHSLTKNEESVELGQLQKESISDLNELLRLLEEIEPLWQKQIDFISDNNEKVHNDIDKIKELSAILQREGEILRMEETLLRKIDLKTGSILRKTSLKEKGIAKTKNSDVNYRELKYIR
ncbi:MAG: hypothetical protein ACP5N1_07225 [Candidatus Woesearchaeota archaeon]